MISPAVYVGNVMCKRHLHHCIIMQHKVIMYSNGIVGQGTSRALDDDCMLSVSSLSTTFFNSSVPLHDFILYMSSIKKIISFHCGYVFLRITIDDSRKHQKKKKIISSWLRSQKFLPSHSAAVVTLAAAKLHTSTLRHHTRRQHPVTLLILPSNDNDFLSQPCAIMISLKLGIFISCVL